MSRLEFVNPDQRVPESRARLKPGEPLDLDSALFLAALPLRRSFFQRGGWSTLPAPDQPAGRAALDAALQTGFTPRHRDAAQRSAECERAVWREDYGYVSIWSPRYPARLRSIYDAPPVLFYQRIDPRSEQRIDSASRSEDLADFLENPFPIAIVGTRNPHQLSIRAVDFYLDRLLASSEYAATSAPGKSSQHRDVAEAAEYHEEREARLPPARASRNAPRPCIISGFARGIDRAAHLAAFARCLPTVAVLGAGLACAGPRGNLDLLHHARRDRLPLLLLSEFPPSTPAFAAHFPRRNRIIAGLCEQLAVFQAPRRSGALISASFALEEGRDVLAFDHPALPSAANDGCRILLDEGATPITLPDLDRHLRREPAARPQRVAFWREVLFGRLQPLGGDLYWES